MGLFDSFAGYPLPLSCGWSPGMMDSGGGRVVLEHGWCLDLAPWPEKPEFSC
jgi:hypothetical protein